MQIRRAICLLVAMSTLAAARTSVRGAKKSNQPLSIPSPGPGPAPGPSGPSIDAVSVTFEVKNLNYYDLSEPLDAYKDDLTAKMKVATKEVEAKKAKADARDAKKTAEKESPVEEAVEGAEQTVEGKKEGEQVEEAEQTVDNIAEDIDQGVEEVFKDAKKGTQLLQLKVATPGVHGAGQLTVAQALKHEIKGAVMHSICTDNPMFGPGPAPGPFPAPAPAGWTSIPQPLPGANLPPPVNPVSLLAKQAPPTPAFFASSVPSPAPGPAGAFCSDHGLASTAVVRFTVANVSYNMLEQKAQAKDGFVRAIQASTAESAGAHFGASDVSVTLASSVVAFVQVSAGQAPGGVAVTTALTVPAGVDAPHIDPASLAGHVETALHAIPDIQTVATGEIRVKEPQIQLPVETGPHLHVTFSPGEPMHKKHHENMVNKPTTGPPRTTLVTVSIYDRPGNGLPDMALAKQELTEAIGNGELHHNVFHAFRRVTGFKPVIWRDGFKLGAQKFWAWDDAGCMRQMSSLISKFTKAYTKRQVPIALFNECTNFITKFSFSHDYVLDPHDTFRCRKATVHFAQKWHLGHSQSPEDFKEMCHTFCEHKFGNDAPMCHITSGANLAGSPL